MHQRKYYLAGLLCLAAAPCLALESISEEELSAASAQDGISLGVILPTAGWTAQSVALIDQTGVPSTIKPGYEFNSATLLAKSVGLKACTEAVINSTCTSSISGFMLNFDAVGDMGFGAMLNVGVRLFNASKIRVYVDKIALRNGLGANEGTLIDFNHQDAANGNKDYIDLLPTTSTLFNIQLGNESSGHMISFGTTVFNQIDFGEVRFTDKNDTGVGGNGRNLRFNLLVDNVNLTAAGIDLAPEGLVISTPNLNNMNVTFGNISAGTSAINMGTVGVRSLNLSNHTLTIVGKS